jgi:hypothetical protein
MMAERGSASTIASDLKFHKETQLLIAVGHEMEVQVIEDVLKALRPDLGSAQMKPKAPEGVAKTNAPTAINKPAKF